MGNRSCFIISAENLSERLITTDNHIFFTAPVINKSFWLCHILAFLVTGSYCKTPIVCSPLFNDFHMVNNAELKGANTNIHCLCCQEFVVCCQEELEIGPSLFSPEIPRYYIPLLRLFDQLRLLHLQWF